jgi:transposase
MRKLLQRLGCSFHQVSGFLFKADPDKQQAFLEAFEQEKQTTPAEGGRRYFLDGVHPLYGLEVLFGCWLLVGQRFEVGVGGGRKRFNILGAYCPDDHEYLDRRYTDKNLNAQSLVELFTLMMARHPETKLFRIYLDNARYQHAVVLREWLAQVKHERGVVFDLKYLPAYSPNLNLIERLWKFLRKEALQKWHPTFEDMQKAIADVLDHLDRYHAELDSLMTERFHLTPRVETVVVGVGRAA